ncbi:MAG: DNA/RNA nuclease SfsA [Treponema sp.]|nr:DNA/RNA nuclease SfsA [Treponema sp.]
MQYEKTVSGIFIDRPNRFIAHVEIDGVVETVHVKNTGRCKELLVPGCKVILEDFRSRPGFENRKTKFDLISVYKITDGHENNPLLINMDSQLPNKVVMEWLQNLPAERAYSFIKPEFTYGNSRVDFYMENEASGGVQKYLMEVKGCTLERGGSAVSSV